MGTAVRFIPRPVVIGFTNGIALLIASTQVKDFFGLTMERVPGEFLRAHGAAWPATSTRSPWPTYARRAVAASSLIVLLVNRRLPRVPGTIVALVARHAGRVVAFGLPVETIGTRFGGIPSGLPALQLPAFRLDLVPVLLSPALTVAMLGAIESLMSAVVADRMSGDRHNPNVELVAQGVANIALAALRRPARHRRHRPHRHQHPLGRQDAGGRHDPRADPAGRPAVRRAARRLHPAGRSLAAILMVVAYNMGEWREIPELLKLTPGRHQRVAGHLRC